MFTDINVPSEYYKDVIKRQAVVNAGVTFVFTDESGEKKEVTEYCYENGIKDYVEEVADLQSLTPVVLSLIHI